MSLGPPVCFFSYFSLKYYDLICITIRNWILDLKIDFRCKNQDIIFIFYKNNLRSDLVVQTYPPLIFNFNLI